MKSVVENPENDKESGYSGGFGLKNASMKFSEGGKTSNANIKFTGPSKPGLQIEIDSDSDDNIFAGGDIGEENLNINLKQQPETKPMPAA
mmetsp:Transcript_33546/g.51578  ORF Transcript_33546/g.51578 Transcript_33546/m.51578 type:complete len:90 (+) Transcript_33546:779-1048(+)